MAKVLTTPKASAAKPKDEVPSLQSLNKVIEDLYREIAFLRGQAGATSIQSDIRFDKNASVVGGLSVGKDQDPKASLRVMAPLTKVEEVNTEPVATRYGYRPTIIVEAPKDFIATIDPLALASGVQMIRPGALIAWQREGLPETLMATLHVNETELTLRGTSNTVRVLHIIGSNGPVTTFPTFETSARPMLILENNPASATTEIAFVVGATRTSRIAFYGSGDTAADGVISYNRNTRRMNFATAGISWVGITSAGSVLLATGGALVTTATDGFTYIPSCAGTPTGVPTSQTGTIPLVYDSTNNILYAYSNGAWRAH